MSLWLVICGKEEKKEGEILLRDKEQCIVPSAGARQRSVRKTRTGLLAAACFSFGHFPLKAEATQISRFLLLP